MNLSYQDLTLIIIYALIAVFATHKLLTFQNEYQSSFNEIAQVMKVSGNSKTMSVNSLSWQSLSKGAALGEGNKVFTENNSKTVITFDDGASIELGSLTLVTLTKEDIKFEGGTVKILSSGNARKLKLNSKDLSSFVTNEEFVLKNNILNKLPRGITIITTRDKRVSEVAKSLVVNNAGRELKLNSHGNVISLVTPIVPEQVVEPEVIKKPEPLKTPAAIVAEKTVSEEDFCGGVKGSVEVIPLEKSAKLLYSFTGMEKEREYSLQLLGNKKSLIWKDTLADSKGKINIEKKQRPVEFELKCGRASFKGKVKVQHLNRVELVDRVVYMNTTKDSLKDLTLKWSSVQNAVSYQVVFYTIDKNNEFKETFKKNIYDLKLKIPELKRGEYYFTVTALDFYGEKGVTSELGFVKLE